MTGLLAFYLSYNHKSREPEYVALFLDNICAPDINFVSVCCIFQLLNALKTNIYGSG